MLAKYESDPQEQSSDMQSTRNSKAENSYWFKKANKLKHEAWLSMSDEEKNVCAIEAKRRRFAANATRNLSYIADETIRRDAIESFMKTVGEMVRPYLPVDLHILLVLLIFIVDSC